MYEHPKLTAFTDTLDAIFKDVDELLEDKWGDTFALHPNRPERGTTGNPEMDGLFEIIPDFTAGLGSEQGRGYLVSLRAATLEQIPEEQFEAFMSEAARLISEKIPEHFPERDLKVVRDGKRFKIIGDFSLGTT
jgi:hypothetical protein